MSHENRMREFNQRKAHQLGLGGPEKLEARKAAGKLNARERIQYFFDPDTFQELGLFGHSARPGLAESTPTDGKIVGYGLVQGRTVGVVANDLTILGASSSATNMKKMDYLRSVSVEKGLPLAFLAESTGARMPDAMGALGMAQAGQNPAQYRRLREAPWLSVLLGPCYGSSSWYSAMSDLTIMQKGAVMAVSSPRVTALATGEDIPPEELGGWKLHSRITGLVDAVAETEEQCLDLAKRFLGYLPAHAGELPPRVEFDAGSTEKAANPLEYLPEERHRGYDMRKIVRTIVDAGDILEVKPEFGRPCITALARLEGRSIGLVANNPLYGAGALDADCCEKITSFLVLCDSFNIPIVTLVDTPGFLVGQAGERRKITGKIINWMNALSLVTVPKITVVIRKIYGQAYLNMGGGKYSDVFAAWPTAEISFMGLEPGINVVFNVRKENDPARFEELLGQMAKDTEPWDSAGVFGLNEIIDPAETRGFIVRMLEMHRNRGTGGLSRHLLHDWPTSY
ncbi:MAG: carboxyl transferase domain-containing protein [Thermodesulfobacteriota bacterium]